MVIDVWRDAVAFIINIHYATVGDTCRRQDMPLHHPLNHLLEHRRQWIYLFIPYDSWRIPILVLVYKVQGYNT